MSHERDHVIIEGLNWTISYGRSSAYKVWQVALALLTVGAVVGALVF